MIILISHSIVENRLFIINWYCNGKTCMVSFLIFGFPLFNLCEIPGIFFLILKWSLLTLLQVLDGRP